MTFRYAGPFGARGVPTVHFDLPVATEDQLTYWTGVLTAIPGVEIRGERALCTWDAAPVVASYLRVPCKLPDTTPAHLPGVERAKALGLHETLRGYQRMGARFLGVRHSAYLAFGCRTGKVATMLTGAKLAGVARMFVATESVAKHGWNQDIWRWVHEKAFVLRGRTGTRARMACRTCDRTGRLQDESPCPDCKTDNGSSYGWRLFKVRRLIRDRKIKDSLIARCRVHRDVEGLEGDECIKCLKEFIAEFRAASVVLSSYDLLSEHPGRKKTGGVYRRSDLPGFASRIATGDFHLGVLDEADLLRGDYKFKRGNKHGSERNQRVRQATRNMPMLWADSATPMRAYTRELYTQLDLLNPDSFGRGRLSFDERYCAAYKQGYGGWENKGLSVLGKTELPDRLSHIMLKATRAELMGQDDGPAKVRQVVVHEAPEGKKPKRVSMGVGIPLRELLAQTLMFKIDSIVESIMKDIAEGTKVAVFTLTRQNTETVAAALEKAFDGRTYRDLARRHGSRVYIGDGRVDGEARGELADTFSKDPSASVWVSTIQAARIGISLAGVHTVHFADISDQPGLMLQAEERPNVIGRVHGLAILFHALEGSIDESIAEGLVRKLPHLESVLNDGDAAKIREAVESVEQSIENTYSRWQQQLADIDIDDYDDD